MLYLDIIQTFVREVINEPRPSMVPSLEKTSQSIRSGWKTPATLQDINVAQVCHENNRLVVTNNNALRPTIHSVGKYILSMTFVGREHGWTQMSSLEKSVPRNIWEPPLNNPRKDRTLEFAPSFWVTIRSFYTLNSLTLAEIANSCTALPVKPLNWTPTCQQSLRRIHMGLSHGTPSKGLTCWSSVDINGTNSVKC